MLHNFINMKNRLLNIVTVIQARTGSGRLPGKVLLEAAGKTMLEHMIERVNRAHLKGRIVVATTNERNDDVIEQLCRRIEVDCFRGSTGDLVQRHFLAAVKYSADVVVKIPSDCPLINPAIIDKTIDHFVKNRLNYDYVSNLHPPTYPDGNDVEVFSFNALYLTNKFAKEEYEREHTTPYIWSNPGQFRIGNVTWDRGLDYSLSHRFVLDYGEDYEFIREVFENLYYADPCFTLDDILDLLYLRRPIWEINAHLRGISWYSKFANDPKAFKLIQRNNNRTINGINTGKDNLAFCKVS